MLKRLFIGLLIFSALTSEGTALFNTALAPLRGQIFALYGAQNGADEKEISPQEKEGLFGHVRIRFGAFVPMQEILQQHGAADKELPAFFSGAELSLNPGVYSFVPQAPAAHRADIALNGADASPPYRS